MQIAKSQRREIACGEGASGGYARAIEAGLQGKIAGKRSPDAQTQVFLVPFLATLPFAEMMADGVQLAAC